MPMDQSSHQTHSKMLTLLLVIMFAKFGLSQQHSTAKYHELQTVVLDTLYGPEHLKIIKESDCSPSWKELQEDVLCKPRERIIPLGHEFLPSAIKINRCSGVCGFTKRGQCPEECHSVERRNVTFTAYKLKKNKECVRITIEEDVACGCKTKTMLNIQHGKLWDKKKCKFVCPKKHCTTGSILDQNSCRCVMKRNVH